MPPVGLFSFLPGHVYSQRGSCAMPCRLGLVHLYSGQWEKAHVRNITENKSATASRIKWKMEAKCLSIRCSFFAHLLRTGLVRQMVFLSPKQLVGGQQEDGLRVLETVVSRFSLAVGVVLGVAELQLTDEWETDSKSCWALCVHCTQ